MTDILIDCDTCYGEGWCWDLALNDERPCTDCDGLGFVRQVEALSAIKGDKS